MPTPFFLKKKLHPLHLPLPLIIGNMASHVPLYTSSESGAEGDPNPLDTMGISVLGTVSEVTKLKIIRPPLAYKGSILCFWILPLTQCFVVISCLACSQ